MNNELQSLLNMNLELFEDETSRLTYLAQVYYNITGDYSYIGKLLYELCHNHMDSFSSDDFKKAIGKVMPQIDKMQPVSRFMVDNGSMFFDPQIVKLSDNEVFCDCGALEMATSIEFAYRVNNHFKKIYAIEPDPVCAEMCRDNIKMFDKSVRDNVFFYDFGLDDTDGTRPFSRSTVVGNSRITDKSEESIKVRRLDGVDEFKDITFLKIHTEGNELAVVKGAGETIRKNKPTVAVSLYHNLKELINVPLILHGLVPEYRFYMRHYSTGTSESVFYAVR